MTDNTVDGFWLHHDVSHALFQDRKLVTQLADPILRATARCSCIDHKVPQLTTPSSNVEPFQKPMTAAVQQRPRAPHAASTRTGPTPDDQTPSVKH